MIAAADAGDSAAGGPEQPRKKKKGKKRSEPTFVSGAEESPPSGVL